MSVRSVLPPAAVFQSAATPADRTSHRSPSVVGVCVARARVRAGVAQCAAGACVLVCGRGAMFCKQEEKTARREEGGNPEQERGRCVRAARPPRVVGAACQAMHRRKAPCVCCGAERTEGSWSGARGIAMILCIRRLWARARAGALALARRCTCSSIVLAWRSCVCASRLWVRARAIGRVDRSARGGI